MIHILNILFYISYIFNDQKRNNSCLFSKRIIGWSIMQSKSTIKPNRLVRNIRDTHAEQPLTKLSCSEQYITVYIVKQYIYFFHLLFIKEELLCSLYRWGFWHAKRKSNLLKATQVSGGGVNANPRQPDSKGLLGTCATITTNMIWSRAICLLSWMPGWAFRSDMVSIGFSRKHFSNSKHFMLSVLRRSIPDDRYLDLNREQWYLLLI